jgi:heat-inducible transcriptional repressor
MCIATTPQPRAGIVTSLETVRVAPNAVVISVVIGPGRERTVSVRFDSAQAVQAASMLLSRFSRSIVGRSLEQATRAVARAKLPGRDPGGGFGRLRTALDHLLGGNDCGVHIFGTGNVISGLGDIEDARSLLEILESRRSVAKLLLTDRSKTGTTVRIGSENRYVPMRRCSVVRSFYRMGEASGAIGLIGPLRMEYARLMALADYTSQELTRYLAKAGGRCRGARQTERP